MSVNRLILNIFLGTKLPQQQITASGIIFVWYGLLKAERSLYITICQGFKKPRNFQKIKRFLVGTPVMLFLCFAD